MAGVPVFASASAASRMRCCCGHAAHGVPARSWCAATAAARSSAMSASTGPPSRAAATTAACAALNRRWAAIRGAGISGVVAMGAGYDGALSAGRATLFMGGVRRPDWLNGRPGHRLRASTVHATRPRPPMVTQGPCPVARSPTAAGRSYVRTLTVRCVYRTGRSTQSGELPLCLGTLLPRQPGQELPLPYDATGEQVNTPDVIPEPGGRLFIPRSIAEASQAPRGNGEQGAGEGDLDVRTQGPDRGGPVRGTEYPPDGVNSPDAPVSQMRMQMEQAWAGPLPDPATLGFYEQILPGAAERILTMAEETTTRHLRTADKLADAEIETAKTGQSLAFGLAIIAFASAIVFFSLGNTLAGGLFLSVPVLMFIKSFLDSVRR